MKTILVIDDDADFRNLIVTYVNKAYPDIKTVGYDPVAEGLPSDNFAWPDYDVLILDHYLCIPGHTGLDILQKGKSNPDFPATIMLTGATDEEIAIRALKSGAHEFIRKEQLTKEKLKLAIEGAWNAQKIKSKKNKQIQLRNRAFNKNYFYQKLKSIQHNDDHSKLFCLLSFKAKYIEQENHKTDLIIRDNIIRHIAKNCFHYLSKNKLEPFITQIDENSIGVLFESSIKANQAEKIINEIHHFLIEKPLVYEGKDTNYRIISSALINPGLQISSNDFLKKLKLTIRDAEQADVGQKRPYILTLEQKHLSTTDSAKSASLDKISSSQPAAENLITDDQKEIAPRKSDTSITNDIVPDETEAPKDKKVSIESYALQYDPSKLDAQAKNIINALDEKRIVQIFRPIIILYNPEDMVPDTEFFHTSLQLIDENGDTISAQSLLADKKHDEINKYIDRWMLKKTIGRIVDLKDEGAKYYFIIQLSHASLSDATFFNWLRELLTSITQTHPGRNIILEIAQGDLENNFKQVNALMTYLNKTHDFRFAIGHIENVSHIKELVNKCKINFLILKYQLIDELMRIAVADDASDNFTQQLKQKNIRLLARNIEDSNDLMQAISLSADFAMGDFVGLSQNQFGESTGIENFELH